MEAKPAGGSSFGDNPERSRMWVAVSKAGTLLMQTERKKANFISCAYLANVAPWLTPGAKTSLKVTYPVGQTVYTCYRGGPIWIARVPRDIAQPGEIFEITFERLTTSEFVMSLHDMDLTYKESARWMSRTSTIRNFRLQDDFLSFEVCQSPNLEGVSSFAVKGKIGTHLQFNAGMTWIDFRVPDAFGNSRLLRLAHNGQGHQMLCLKAGRHFARVHLVSCDGFRLNFVYKSTSRDTNVATVYLEQPSSLYSLTPISCGPPDYRIPGVVRFYQIESVTLVRDLERAMVDNRHRYAVGRIGAEISYAIGRKLLHLHGLVIIEPSVGGKDLYTSDVTTIVQSRMLTPRSYNATTVRQVVKSQLERLVKKLHVDFRYNADAMTGFGIISYVDPISLVIHTVIAEVKRPPFVKLKTRE